MKFDRKKREHEDNVKQELFRWCAKGGIKLHLEYGVGNCRFDAVVVRGDDIICLIEVKNWRSNKQALSKTKKESEQLKKYLSHGLPVLWLWNKKGVKELYYHITNLLGNYDSEGRIAKCKVTYFPKIKEDELERLIKQQAKDLKWDSRIFAQNKPA